MKVLVTSSGLGLAGLALAKPDVAVAVELKFSPATMGDDIETVFGMVAERIGAGIAVVQGGHSSCVEISLVLRSK